MDKGGRLRYVGCVDDLRQALRSSMANILPPLYERWIEKLLGSPIPPEEEATCQNCAMVADPDGAESEDQTFFDSTTRCCTYLPDLPNFLVGRILAETDPRLAAGRRSVQARLGRRVAVTPLGLGKPATYSLLYRNSSDGFGASHTLRCPHHLEDGSCGIWPHRMSICATWFCKYSRGAVGLRFWRVLQVLLREVEGNLARWCLLRLRLGVRELAHLFPPPDPVPPSRTLDRYQLDQRVDPKEYAALWGDWAGRESEFFQECGREVARLDWQEVLSICGPEVQISARLVTDAFAALRSRELPARLRVGRFVACRTAPGSTLVVSYNAFDPLRLPGELMEALPFFEGRTVKAALGAIAREKPIQLDLDVVRTLVDFEVLLPAAEDGGGPSGPSVEPQVGQPAGGPGELG
jgi:hypothetical protein